MSFPRYPEYKDSGVEWLGEVPAHWDIFPIKRDLEFLTSGSRGWASHYADDGAAFIRIGNLTRDHIHLDLTDLQCVNVPEGSEGERTKVKTGDVLFSITAYLGSVAVVPDDIETAYVSQHVALARLFQRKLLPSWVAYVTLSDVGKNYLSSQGYGGTKIQLSLEDVADLLVTAPPLCEQASITSFLDHETARIDALVEQQQRLIELLKEKRQAVISHAVTKGLDPDVPMKDSGVDGLGEVPTHWEVIKLGLIASEKCDGPFGSALKSEHYTDHGVRVVRLQNIKSGRYNDSDSAYIDEGYYNRSIAKSDVVSGDVLIAGLGDERNIVGRACVAPSGIEPAMVKADCFRFRLIQDKACPEFVAEQLSSGAEADAGVMASGSTRSRIPLSTMGTRKVALPPMKEQVDICKHLSDVKNTFDLLSEEAELAIRLLQERRSSLISAAVTGKIDVSNEVYVERVDML